MEKLHLRVLLGHLKNNTNNQKIVNAASREIYKRIIDDLNTYHFYLRDGYSLFPELEKDDFIQDALVVFFTNPEFDENRQEYEDEERIRKSLIKYIATIAKNICRDKVRNLVRTFERRQNSVKLYSSKVENEDIFPTPLDEENRLIKFYKIKGYNKISFELFTRIVQDLTAREYDVIMTYAEHHGSHLPSSVVESLCKKHTITSGHLRVLKFRILKKLKLQLERELE